MEEISTCSSHEKCEAFDDYIFMTVRTCNTDLFAESHYTAGGTSPPLGRPSSEPINLYILMFKQFTLSLHYQPMPIVTQVTRKIFQRRKQVKLTSDWYFYFLLDEVIDQFEPNLKKLEHEVDELDETTLFLKPADQTEMLRRIGRARNLVTHLSRLLKTKIETTKSITKRYNDRIQEQALLYLRDTHDKLLSLISSLDQNSETLTRAHSNYLAQISIEQAEMSNRMNLQVKHLTVITSLSLPFEIVGALWGMNVAVPFEIIDNRDVYLEELKPFFGLVLGCIVLSFIFWLVGRRLRFF